MPLCLLFVLAFALLVPIGLCTAVCICALRPERRVHADSIIVLGAKVHPDGTLSTTLRRRCDAALAVYARGVATKMILCGGQGRDETESEAAAMCRYMMAAGVPRGDIILEGESTSTVQNLENAKVLMYAHDLHCATIVTSDYHLTRAMWLASGLGMCVGGVPAPGPERVHHIIKTRIRETLSWCLYFWNKIMQKKQD